MTSEIYGSGPPALLSLPWWLPPQPKMIHHNEPISFSPEIGIQELAMYFVVLKLL